MGIVLTNNVEDQRERFESAIHNQLVLANLYAANHPNFLSKDEYCRRRDGIYVNDDVRKGWAIWKMATKAGRNIGYIELPTGLNKHTMKLVVDFAESMAEKLRIAEVKYKWSDEWRQDNWKPAFNLQFKQHVYKGDPVDVANYCAFAWHHQWTTTGDINAKSTSSSSTSG